MIVLTADRRHLAMILSQIEANDEKYEVRYKLVLEAVSMAAMLGYHAGFRIDPSEPEWPVAFITLPEVGQVSWHVPQFKWEWDGHSTEEKYHRIRQFNTYLFGL